MIYGDFLPKGQAHRKRSKATLFKIGSSTHFGFQSLPLWRVYTCRENPFPLRRLSQISPKDLKRMNMFPYFYHEMLPPNFWEKALFLFGRVDIDIHVDTRKCSHFQRSFLLPLVPWVDFFFFFSVIKKYMIFLVITMYNLSVFIDSLSRILINCKYNEHHQFSLTTGTLFLGQTRKD